MVTIRNPVGGPGNSPYFETQCYLMVEHFSEKKKPSSRSTPSTERCCRKRLPNVFDRANCTNPGSTNYARTYPTLILESGLRRDISRPKQPQKPAFGYRDPSHARKERNLPSQKSPDSPPKRENKPKTSRKHQSEQSTPPIPPGPLITCHGQKLPKNKPNLFKNTPKTATSFVKIVRREGKG